MANALPLPQKFRGKHRFFCGGRIMFGPSNLHFTFTVCSILLTWGLFFLLVFPRLPIPSFLRTSRGSSFDRNLFSSYFLFLLSASLFFLLRTALTDPGILPRASPSNLVDSMPLEMKEKMNYCNTCHRIKPLRTKHCRQTDSVR